MQTTALRKGRNSCQQQWRNGSSNVNILWYGTHNKSSIFPQSFYFTVIHDRNVRTLPKKVICTCFIITRRQTGCHDTLWRKPLRLEKLLIAFPFSISALPCVVKSLVPALYPVDQAHGFIASYRVFLSRYMSRPLSHYLAPSRRLPPFHRRKRKWLRVSDHCYRNEKNDDYCTFMFQQPTV